MYLASSFYCVVVDAPLTATIIGHTNPLRENNIYTFTCTTNFANPPANVSWGILYENDSTVDLRSTNQDVSYINSYYK